jgi:glycosyltransferase involved in cell wall biosynthesis
MACNDERTLARCLASLAFAEEILVVVDTKSVDQSEKIASELATRVVVHRYEGDLEQKRFATGLARMDWVLSVDADEVVSPELAASIWRALGRSGAPAAGFEVNRVAWHLGCWVRHGDWHPDWKLRLFERSRARWSGRNPHGRAEVAGRVERLAGDLYHYSYRDLADQHERIGVHTTQAAEALYREGRRPRMRDLVLRPPASFLRSYVLERGFLDGVVGFVVAASVAYSVFLKYAKLRELVRRRADGDEGAGVGEGEQ